MKIDDLLALIEADSVLDKSNLDTESLKITQLYIKYYRIFMDEVRVLKSYDLKYAEMKKERQEFYLGLSADEVYKAEPLQKKWMKTDLDIPMNADPKLSEIDVKRDLQKHKVKLLEDYIKRIGERSFNIKNAIDFMKFQNGG